MIRLTKKLFLWVSVVFAFIIVLGFLSLLLLSDIIKDIPDYQELSSYRPSGITRLYDSNGKILDEYASERRIYIKYESIPKVIIDAFIAVEDKNFFDHKGIDTISILRASFQNILNIAKNKRLVGGSTIIQQIVKDFFLTNERSFTRKLKEAILAFRVNKVFSKEKLLEIYLNQIYLGQHSYGIYVATQNYFGKNLSDITIEEAALLASLPKAPSTLNPYKNYNRALERRNWAIQRMAEEGTISSEEKLKAIKSPIKLYHPSKKTNYENHYTNTVKSELVDLFGINNVYNQGYIVNTNINIKLHNIAQEALRNGLKKFDKQNGWRGVFAKIDPLQQNINETLNAIAKANYHDSYMLGMVKKINSETLDIILSDNQYIQLTKDAYSWITKGQPAKHFKAGDVILIDKVNDKTYKIEQIPEIEGAIIVIENISGKVLALVGGYDFKKSSFNRATQAYRQPGSVLKTFIYLLAFEQGISPNSLVLDEPLEIDLGHRLPVWKPKNYFDEYHGLITLRTSFEKSTNVSALRLMLGIGLNKLIEITQRYLIYSSNIKATYSIALGAFETTLLKITNAYASIGNNGILKQPKLIDSVYDRNGQLLYSPKDSFCTNCSIDNLQIKNDEIPSIPTLGFLGKVVTDKQSNYQILSLLKGTVERGSAKRANILKRKIAGKTGTTNDSLDTWFIGLTPDITVGVFVGYDIPKKIRENASGSNIPLPIFIDFFKKANFIPDNQFQIPDSIRKMYINKKTGEVVEKHKFVAGNEYIEESFKADSLINTEEELDDIIKK